MHIQLEPFERADFDRLISWVPDAAFLMLWSGPFFTSPLDHAQLEAYYLSGQLNPSLRKIYKAVDSRSRAVLGHIELNTIDWRNRSASVSKVLVGEKHAQNQGVGSQMVARLLEIAFDEMKLHRLELRVFDFNQAAIRCYEKNGFSIEGHLRDYRKVQDQYWSSYLMSILEDEWRGRPSAGPG